MNRKMYSFQISYILSKNPHKLDMLEESWANDTGLTVLSKIHQMKIKATKQEHGCAAVGGNFKPDMVLYNAKSYRRMSYEVYVNQILILLLDNSLRIWMTLY